MTVILGNTHNHLFPLPFEPLFEIKQKYPYLAFARSKLTDQIIAYGSVKASSGLSRGQHSTAAMGVQEELQGGQNLETDSGNGSGGARQSLHGKYQKECYPLMD